MTDNNKWSETTPKDGVMEITLQSWKYFSDLDQDKFSIGPRFIFRGQANSDWPLESRLYRLRKYKESSDAAQVHSSHLEMFKNASRGRRGHNPPHLEGENDWWALGQHYGLATPLLDWTESQFIALYFAFIEDVEPTKSPNRAVFALSEETTRAKVKANRENDREYNKSGWIQIIRPQSDENPRLVSQLGLFTRTPNAFSVDDWVKHYFAGSSNDIALYKIIIPNQDRSIILHHLNRMNINHLSLFPDLQGAAEYCNMNLSITNY